MARGAVRPAARSDDMASFSLSLRLGERSSLQFFARGADAQGGAVF
jgi:hypothetical protein